MGRIKNYQTVTKTVQAIQFVRNAINDVYEFLDKRNMTVNFINDKFSGTIIDDKGKTLQLTGKDYIVKEEDGIISKYSEADFNTLFIEVTS